MAKRKRLAPAEPGQPVRAGQVKSFTRFPAAGSDDAPARPPIAQVAGDAASSAALEEIAEELRNARESGRMVLSLPLDVIDESYLVRDRIDADDDEMDQLQENIAAHGQRTPIEVVDLGDGRYGLISGWRRLTALRRLGGPKVLALLRQPDTAPDAYRAMVEENELRRALSYYERARIVAKAADQGVFHNDDVALKGLFGSVSRAKRSKIGAFLRVYRELDGRLKFPAAISERLGLQLARNLKVEDGFADRVSERLRKADPETAFDEVTVLERAARAAGQKQSLIIAIDTDSAPESSPVPSADKTEFGSVTMLVVAEGRRILLSGAGVTPEFRARLEAWLAGQGG